MTDMTIHEGDIFRWKYADERPEDLGSYKRYHCKSQIAIAKDGRLQDTYWGSSPSCAWTYDEALERLYLKHIGNFSEFEKKPGYLAECYDAKDYLDLNHPNSSRGNFYIRKGAQRSEQKMREMIAYKIEKEESTIRVAGWSIENLKKELKKIDDGLPLEQVYI